MTEGLYPLLPARLSCFNGISHSLSMAEIREPYSLATTAFSSNRLERRIMSALVRYRMMLCCPVLMDGCAYMVNLVDVLVTSGYMVHVLVVPGLVEAAYHISFLG